MPEEAERFLNSRCGPRAGAPDPGSERRAPSSTAGCAASSWAEARGHVIPERNGSLLPPVSLFNSIGLVLSGICCPITNHPTTKGLKTTIIPHDILSWRGGCSAGLPGVAPVAALTWLEGPHVSATRLAVGHGDQLRCLCSFHIVSYPS